VVTRQVGDTDYEVACSESPVHLATVIEEDELGPEAQIAAQFTPVHSERHSGPENRGSRVAAAICGRFLHPAGPHRSY